MSDVLQILLYGLLAAASPGTLVAILAVLGTERARANGSAFAIGFILGQSLTLSIIVVVGSVTIPGSSDGSAALEFAVGVLLLLTANRTRRPGKAKPRRLGGHSRTAHLVERLQRVSPRTAFSVGVTLGIGLKRLVITAFAASTIALADVSRSQAFGLGALYIVVATLPVWVPVAGYLVAGKHADEWVASAKAWVAANQRLATSYISLVFGLCFLVGGLVQVV
jgi:threonine/homoserine/homoserine lactone efflux protein